MTFLILKEVNVTEEWLIDSNKSRKMKYAFCPYQKTQWHKKNHFGRQNTKKKRKKTLKTQMEP